MIKIKFLLLALLLAFAGASFSQNKAVILQNTWSNDLNNFTPKEYFDRLSAILKEKLAVSEISESPASRTFTKTDQDWVKKAGEQVKQMNISPDSAYFIAIASDLRLPALNLGKLLFKNPPRSSKLTFTIHIYDSKGTELIADTLVNRGCLSATVDAQKGGKFFYADYKSFMDDMQCHLNVIRLWLQEKTLPKKKAFNVI